LYDFTLHFCQAGTNEVKERCGTRTYNEGYFCQSPNVVKELCGGTEEYASTHFCQAGTDEVKELCGGTEVYYSTQFCYNNSKVGEFCGNNPQKYDPDLYECSYNVNANANGIYLKNKPKDLAGREYKAVLIGTQTWMAENLNYNASGSKCGSVLTGLGTVGTVGDANTPVCDKYGRLYNWATAMAGVCPAGWHLPSNAEWNVLMKFVNPSCTDDNRYCDFAGTKLKADSPLWNSNGKGTDEFGFSALPGGEGLSDGYFLGAGDGGNWWSTSEDNASNAYYRNMSYGKESAYYDYSNKSNLFSVRCLQDSP
jgi:uncharacterized protein (TIGR02145 family)